MSPLPSGRVTFLFTDIEGSSDMFAARPNEYPALLELHNQAIRAAVDDAGGHVVSTEGDAFFVAFADADQALRAATAAQRALAETNWPEGAELRVRMGLHTGSAQPTNDNYVAFCIHQAARVVDAANGGQIAVSSATAAAVGGTPGIHLLPRGRFQLRNFPEPEPLFTVSADGLDDDQPLRARPERSDNLPAFRTELVGRGVELDEVSHLLTQSRVVTLTGLGGVGKTRAATAVASQEVARRDGVWFCALDSVSDPDLVLHTMAEAMGRRLRQGSADELARMVGESNTLVVVDNCEHVLEAAARVIDTLVRTCPELQVLATSQAPLDIDGERVFRLDPLPTAGEASPALALFLERAASAGATWLDQSEDRAAAAELVDRLDGIPFAIELAAGRAATLSPREISARLDQRFSLLASTRRDVLPRRRTLQATIAWSYDLLDGPHAALLRRLAYFAGMFDLAAAEAVGTINELETIDVVDALAALASRSLVVTVDGAGGRQYRLLDSIKAFGLEQARDAGEHAVLALTHARWVLAALPRPESIADLTSDPSVRGRPAAYLHQDVAVALERLIALRAPLSAELAWRASPIWTYLLRLDEGSERLRAAAELTSDPYDKGRCLQALAYLTSVSGVLTTTSYAEAAHLLEEAAAASDDPIVISYSARAQTYAAHEAARFDVEAAERFLDAAAKCATRSGDSEALAGVLRERVSIAIDHGRLDEADELSREHVATATRCSGPALGEALALRSRYFTARGDDARALSTMEEAVTALQGEPKQSHYLRQLAHVSLRSSVDGLEVLGLLARAEDVAASFGWQDEVILARMDATQVHADRGDKASARAMAASAHDLASAIGLETYRAQAASILETLPS